MVKLGSGGANFAGYDAHGTWLNDPDYILGQLPLCQAQSYQQLYWLSQHRVRCKRVGTAPDGGVGLSKLMD